MNWKLIGVIACAALFGGHAYGTPITYQVKNPNFEAFSVGAHSHLDSGFITTDGAIGTLDFSDILAWSFTITETIAFGPPQTSTYGSALGGTLSGTPGTLVATATDLYYDTLNFTGLLSFVGDPSTGRGQFSFIATPTSHLIAFALGASGDFYQEVGPLGPFTPAIINLATNGIAVVVPAPVLGAGLPGLIFACGGLLAWWRRWGLSYDFLRVSAKSVHSALSHTNPALRAVASIST